MQSVIHHVYSQIQVSLNDWKERKGKEKVEKEKKKRKWELVALDFMGFDCDRIHKQIFAPGSFCQHGKFDSKRGRHIRTDSSMSNTGLKNRKDKKETAAETRNQKHSLLLLLSAFDLRCAEWRMCLNWDGCFHKKGTFKFEFKLWMILRELVWEPVVIQNEKYRSPNVT